MTVTDDEAARLWRPRAVRIRGAGGITWITAAALPDRYRLMNGDGVRSVMGDLIINYYAT